MVLAGRAPLGVWFCHRVLGDLSPKECDGHGTTAHAAHSRDSAVEMDVTTQSLGDGPEPGDQCGRGRVGGDPGEGVRTGLTWDTIGALSDDDRLASRDTRELEAD